MLDQILGYDLSAFVWSEVTVTRILDFIGTFAFAISGIRLASTKQMDWFGAYVLGVTTAVGGGTLRDLFLGVTPFWMLQPSYMIITFVALLYVYIFRKIVIRTAPTVFVFDAIGLGLFMVVGVDKTLAMGFPSWVAVIMGTVTGSFGGLLRDIILNETPLICRQDIYALACIAGGIIYTLMLRFVPIDTVYAQLVSAGMVILIRILAARYHWHLPQLKGIDSSH